MSSRSSSGTVAGRASAGRGTSSRDAACASVAYHARAAAAAASATAFATRCTCDFSMIVSPVLGLSDYRARIARGVTRATASTVGVRACVVSALTHLAAAALLASGPIAAAQECPKPDPVEQKAREEACRAAGDE